MWFEPSHEGEIRACLAMPQVTQFLISWFKLPCPHYPGVRDTTQLHMHPR